MPLQQYDPLNPFADLAPEQTQPVEPGIVAPQVQPTQFRPPPPTNIARPAMESFTLPPDLMELLKQKDEQPQPTEQPVEQPQVQQQVPQYQPPPPPVAPVERTVAQGETLSEIAAQQGTTPEQLAQANQIADPNVIQAGQTIDVAQQPAPQVPEAPIGPPAPMESQTGILGTKTGKMGAAAGERQAADVFSGGINTGRDIRVPPGTSVAAPQGEWTVTDSFGEANSKGYIGDNTNDGYGNSVVMVNNETGEKMRFSHLDIGSVKVKQGDVIKGGDVFANVGVTGNSSGPHLDLEYYDAKGRLDDIMNTQYGRQMFGGK